MNRKVFEALVAFIEEHKIDSCDEDAMITEMLVPYTELAEFIAKLYKENH